MFFVYGSGRLCRSVDASCSTGPIGHCAAARAVRHPLDAGQSDIVPLLVQSGTHWMQDSQTFMCRCSCSPAPIGCLTVRHCAAARAAGTSPSSRVDWRAPAGLTSHCRGRLRRRTTAPRHTPIAAVAAARRVEAAVAAAAGGAAASRRSRCGRAPAGRISCASTWRT